jgi:hypothetical protein
VSVWFNDAVYSCASWPVRQPDRLPLLGPGPPRARCGQHGCSLRRTNLNILPQRGACVCVRACAPFNLLPAASTQQRNRWFNLGQHLANVCLACLHWPALESLGWLLGQGQRPSECTSRWWHGTTFASCNSCCPLYADHTHPPSSHPTPSARMSASFDVADRMIVSHHHGSCRLVMGVGASGRSRQGRCWWTWRKV